MICRAFCTPLNYWLKSKKLSLTRFQRNHTSRNGKHCKPGLNTRDQEGEQLLAENCSAERHPAAALLVSWDWKKPLESFDLGL